MEEEEEKKSGFFSSISAFFFTQNRMPASGANPSELCGL